MLKVLSNIRILTPLLSMLVVTSSVAQIPTGTWRTHFAFRKAISIDKGPGLVFAASQNAVTRVDLTTGQMTSMTLMDALSDKGISVIRYHADKDMLIVGYENGNIDLVEENRTTNIPALKLSQLTGSKEIHSILPWGDSAYVSTGIGLLVLDLVKAEVRDVYYPDSNERVIYDAAIVGDTLFLGTDNGIYKAERHNPFLANNALWSKLTGMHSTMVNGTIPHVEGVGQKLVFVFDNEVAQNKDSLISWDGAAFTNVVPSYSGLISGLRSLNDTTFSFTLWSSVKLYDQSHSEIGSVTYYLDNGFPSPYDAVHDGDVFWIADQYQGIVKARHNWMFVNYLLPGPWADIPFRVDMEAGMLAVSGGLTSDGFQNTFNRDGFYTYDGSQWRFFNQRTHDTLSSGSAFDLVGISVDPTNPGRLAVGGVNGRGIFIVEDSTRIAAEYDQYNSTLEERVDYPDNYMFSALQFDANGTLWVCNSLAIDAIKAMDAQGNWYSFNIPSAAGKRIMSLHVDFNGVKWFGVDGVGMIAFSEGGTLSDPSDDWYKVLTTSDGAGALPGNRGTAAALDFDEEMWIGTNQGLAILYRTQDLGNAGPGEYDADQILLNYEGEVEILLGSTYIYDIEIDGGNRKWIATKGSGVIVLSPDGLEEVHHFTQENSPLLSNDVRDIAIDHNTGEVFFATEYGLVSYRSDATYGDQEFSNVRVFPNPVRPNFTGLITVEGLGFNSDVKITDAAGRLVFQGESNGGTFTWDGNTLDGVRAATGVYLVWAGQSEAKGKKVAKFLLVN